MKSAYVHQNFADDMRREDRFAVLFLARMREPGRSAFEVKIINLSASGFCAKTSYWLTEEGQVWLIIPRLEAREARVIWQRDFVCGCVFTRPLHPAVFDHLARNFGFGG